MHQMDMYAETMIRHQQAAAQAQMTRRRLIQEALPERGLRFYRPALVSIGKRMVVWGTQLQQRYDDLHTTQSAARSVVLANK